MADAELLHLRQENARLLSRLQSTKGNILVYVRVRPEAESRGRVDVFDASSLSFFETRASRWKAYRFDRCFAPSAGQARVYDEFEPLAQGVLDGSRVCILAYGQTGSGKTHTMMGTPSDPGISVRLLEKVFAGLPSPPVPGSADVGSWEAALSMVEVYNDEVYSLLDADAGGAPRKVSVLGAETPTYRDSFVRVSSSAEALRLYESGLQGRSTASTLIHEHSSRSHCVVTLHVSQRQAGGVLHGELSLVDLAGSERMEKSGASGARLVELKNINTSLSALGDVLRALDERSAHVPYRNSKLTYLLRESLTYHSKVAIVGAVRDRDEFLDETRCTLEFLVRAKAIELGATSVMLERKKLEETCARLQEELRRASAEGEAQRSENAALRAEAESLRARLASLESARSAQESSSRELQSKLSARTKSLRALEQRVRTLEASQAPSLPIAESPVPSLASGALTPTPLAAPEAPSSSSSSAFPVLDSPLDHPPPVRHSMTARATALLHPSASTLLTPLDWKLIRRSLQRGVESARVGATSLRASASSSQLSSDGQMSPIHAGNGSRLLSSDLLRQVLIPEGLSSSESEDEYGSENSSSPSSPTRPPTTPSSP